MYILIHAFIIIVLLFSALMTMKLFACILFHCSVTPASLPNAILLCHWSLNPYLSITKPN